MANYPTTQPSATPADHGVVLAELLAIAAELGANPRGSSASVAARLAALPKLAGPNAWTGTQDFTGATVTGVAGGTSAVPRLGPIRVASSQAPAAVKAACEKVAPGTNDQDVINEAITLAARASDVTGGIGAGVVELVGGDFFIGNNNTGVIKMLPSVWLRGSGPGTMLQPLYSSYTGLGCIELMSTTVDHTRLSDFTIGRPLSTLARCHGIKYQGVGSGNAYQLQTGNDPFHRIHDVFVLKSSGHGFYVFGTSGGARETQMDQCLSWDAALSGFYYDGSSDSKLTACTAQNGSGGPGFFIGGGNTKVTGCKAYYADGATDGYAISSGRAEIVGCAAQDNGRYGFNVTSQDVTMIGCVADSNARVDVNGGGFLIGSTGTYQGLTAFDRAQTPASPQLRGIIFSGTPQVMLTGRVRVPSGTAHVVGAPGADSFMRVVRDGNTLVTAG